MNIIEVIICFLYVVLSCSLCVMYIGKYYCPGCGSENHTCRLKKCANIMSKSNIVINVMIFLVMNMNC